MTRLPALGPRGEGWLALQIVLLLAIGASGFLLQPGLRGDSRLVAGAFGLLLIVGGVALVGLAARQLGPAATPLPRPEPGADRVESGLYGRVRHPIYVGVVISALGWSLLTASLPALLLVGALIVLLDLKARREEAWLVERYPDYEQYRRRTRRFVPGLY